MLSIVIPSHHRVDLLRACLASVTRHAPAGTEILVVDDASPNSIVTQTAESFTIVRTIRNELRRGFCAAANAGIEATQRPIVQLLNDDTEVCPGWAAAALRRFDDPRIGAVAPLVLKYPTAPDQEPVIDSAGDDYFIGGVARKRHHGKNLSEVTLRPQRVLGASGSAAFYRREAIEEVGAFPESFGAYFEDVDLSFRLHKAGYDVLFEPASLVYHHVSASYGIKLTPELITQQSRNEELVFWRNVPLRSMWCALPLHVLVLIGKAVRRCRRGELRPFLRGRWQVWSHCAEIREH